MVTATKDEKYYPPDKPDKPIYEKKHTDEVKDQIQELFKNRILPRVHYILKQRPVEVKRKITKMQQVMKEFE